MLDEQDEGARIGVWVALGVVVFVLIGVVGGIVLRQMNDKHRRAAATVVQAPAAVVVVDEVILIEGPLAGDLVSTLYFETAKAELPADAAAKIADAVRALAAAGGRKLVISGFHDASGDPARNAELAKQRAVNVRKALIDAGADAARVQLRKPESATGDGTAQEARRVELRLVD